MKKNLSSLLLFLCFVISGFSEGSRPTVCLNMIVKNESKVIEGCLQSLKGLVDAWVIVDTGSTDGTQELIKKTMQGVPGELYERPWVDFSHNRNEAFSLAQDKADYILFIDADERLVFSVDFQKPIFDQDCYLIRCYDKDCELDGSKILMVHTRRDWKWFGSMHEELKSATVQSVETVKGFFCERNTSTSARSQDSEKYHKDAKLLEEALAQDPENSRNVFYLAQSYANAKEPALALKNYEKRVSMGGVVSEVFWSYMTMARLQKTLNYPQETVLASYKKAYQTLPARAEPLFHLGLHYLEIGSNLLAYALAQMALSLPYPSDHGYAEPFVYEYGIKYLWAQSSQALKRYDEAALAYRQMLKSHRLPLDLKISVEQKLRTCEALQ